MASTIGGYTAIGFDGFPQRAGQESVAESRPGVDGEDRQLVGIKPKPGILIGHFQDSTADLRETGIANLFLLKQTYVTIVHFDRTYTNVFVEDVEEIDRFDAIVSTSGRFYVAIKFTLRWTMQ